MKITELVKKLNAEGFAISSVNETSVSVSIFLSDLRNSKHARPLTNRGINELSLFCAKHNLFMRRFSSVVTVYS